MRDLGKQPTFRLFLALWQLAFALLLSSCAESSQDGPINVAFIGEGNGLSEKGLRLSFAGQHVRAATSEGLVTLDPAGRILPNLAERWHVSQDGLFYTFKLREASWPDGEPITAEEVSRILDLTVDQLEGTSLGLDFDKLEEVRAMAGRVIELRLSSPMPEFLRLLAQPELGLMKNGAGSGPMTLAIGEEDDFSTLAALPPESRGLPAVRNWEGLTRPLNLRVLPAKAAVDDFSNGDIDLLLNGKLSDLPLAELGPLSRGTIQIDPTQGIFGLAFLSADGLLADAARREALSMAIDREALIQPFGLAGWQPMTAIVPATVGESAANPIASWSNQSMDVRRATASSRIANWERAAGEQARVRLRLPPGPGNDQLFAQIRDAWSGIGVNTVRVADDAPADVELRDRIARYSSPRWFLNQFNCELRNGLCSEAADALVKSSLELRDPAAKRRVLADAHAVLLAEQVFIPFGAPVRWSLVRGAIAAYEPNPWGIHPLFPLSQIPN